MKIDEFYASEVDRCKAVLANLIEHCVALNLLSPTCNYESAAAVETYSFVRRYGKHGIVLNEDGNVAQKVPQSAYDLYTVPQKGGKRKNARMASTIKAAVEEHYRLLGLLLEFCRDNLEV